jgi:phage gp37-like protein
MTTGCSDASDAIKKFNSDSDDAGTPNTAAYWKAMATAFGDEGRSLNSAAGSADDSGVRTALQNEATIDVQLSDAYNQLADSNPDPNNASEIQDQLDEAKQVQNLLNQNETADQGRIHACQNAAHE